MRLCLLWPVLLLAACRSRGAAALTHAPQPPRFLTVTETLWDLSALLNVVIVGSLSGLVLALAVGCALRGFAPLLARASLGAALGFAAVFGLATAGKVALPFLAWAVVALLAMGIISAVFVLRRVLPLVVQRLKDHLDGDPNTPPSPTPAA